MFMRILFRGACTFLCSCCVMLSTNNGWAKVSLPNSDVISTLPQGSYQVAKVTFLPDLVDSEFGFSGNELDDDKNQDNCKGYQLDSCPEKAFCQRCPFDATKFKILGCATGYYLLNDTCSAGSCSGIDSSYSDTIPNNNICTKFTEGGKTCYKDCQAISCEGYTASCTNKPEHAVTVEKCPDCKDASNSKCNDNVCKVTECDENYKVNADGTGCVLKDDTCPENYYKSCESGTQGEPQYTEMGTACYQCKTSSETCLNYLTANYPDKTIITTQQELQHALIDNKDNLVIAKDFTITTDIDLSGKTVVGAYDIAPDYPACAANPNITVQGQAQIFTNDDSEFRKLNFINKIETKGTCYWTEMISGGGTFRDVGFIFTPEQKTGNNGVTYYTTNYNTPHMAVRGIANFYDIESKGMRHFSVENESTLNIKGKLEASKPVVSEDISGYVIATAGQDPVVNIEKTASIIADVNSSVFSYEGGVGDCMINGDQKYGKNATLNINGDVVHTISGTKYSPYTLQWAHGLININKPITLYGFVNISRSTLNINADTTIKDINSLVGISGDNNTVNINAPLKFVGLKAFDKPLDYEFSNDGPFDVDNAYINSDLIFDAKIDFLPVISTGTIVFGPKANVRGAARWMLSQKNSNTIVRTIKYSSGAKLEIGGVCRQTTSSGTYKPNGTNQIIWTSPQSPFTAACSSSSGSETPELYCGINSSWMTCGGNKCCCPNDRGCDTNSLNKWCFCESTGSEPTACEAGTVWNGTCCETLCGLPTCPCAH